MTLSEFLSENMNPVYQRLSITGIYQIWGHRRRDLIFVQVSMSTPGLTSPRSDFVVSGTKTEEEPRNLIQCLIHPKDTRFPQSFVPFSFFMFLLYQENEVYGGRKVWGVGVMKDKEVMVDEIESSHILGGSGKGNVQVRGKWERYSSYSITLYCRRIHNIYMVVKTLFDCTNWTPETSK